MPRGVPNKKKVLPVSQTSPLPNGTTLAPLESTLDDMRIFLETRRMEYQTSADRLAEIIGTLTTPKPRIGRPPKAAAK